jgi:hypothetical protein
MMIMMMYCQSLLLMIFYKQQFMGDTKSSSLYMKSNTYTE